MRNDGVSLIELLVGISIISILAISLGFSFQGWMSKYRVENQMKELYADLVDARTMAMVRNRMHFVVLNAADYRIYEDTDDDANADIGAGDLPVLQYRLPGTSNVKPKTVKYNLGWTGTVGFDTRGLAWQYTAPATRVAASITVYATLPSGTETDYDCLLIAPSRIRMGKMAGGSCNAR